MRAWIVLLRMLFSGETVLEMRGHGMLCDGGGVRRWMCSRLGEEGRRAVGMGIAVHEVMFRSW